MNVVGADQLDTVELATALHPRLSRLYTMLRGETRYRGLSRTALSVLVRLRDGGPQRITELAEGENVAQPSMTTLVDGLQGRGWVGRARDPGDRRAVLVELSDEGARLLDTLIGERVAALGERLGALSADERAALATALPALDRLIDAPGAR